MTTIYANPTHFGHEPADHARAAAMMERLGIEQVPTMIDDESPPMQRLFAGSCNAGDYHEVTDGPMSFPNFPGYYGIPRVDTNSPQRDHAHRLQYPIAYFSEQLWPDCSVDGERITPDLDRLYEVMRQVFRWGMYGKTIAVAKTFRVSTMAHLTPAEMVRYAKRLAKFSGCYPWMVGRWQFRQYSAMPPDYVDYDKPDLVRSRMEFGDKYLNNPQTMVDDSLAEAEKDLTFFKEIFG